jgi:cytosine deaminase
VAADGSVLESGHNEVFKPQFRSDLHGEMVVMTRFEERQSRPVDLRGCTLYTSLESCPMCLCRLITSGVGRVLYVAADDIGGMVRRRRSLPPVWRDLMKHQEHRQARCSAELKRIALEVFLANVQQLNTRLASERGSGQGT